MGRPARDLHSSSYFHVGNRGIDGCDIFAVDDRNPIAVCGPRGLAAYRWSSLPVYLGRRTAPAWLSTTRLDGLIRPDRHLAEVIRPQPCDRQPMGEFAPSTPTSLAEIESAVSAVLGTGWSETAVGRDLVALIALQLRSADPAALASARGVAPKSLRDAVRLASARLATDEVFARSHGRAMDEINRPTGHRARHDDRTMTAR